MTKQHVSLQVSTLTDLKVAQLAEKWGFPPKRYRSRVFEIAVKIAYELEFGKDEADVRKANTE